MPQSSVYEDRGVRVTLTSPYTESFIWSVIQEKGIYDPYLLKKVRDLGLIKDHSTFIDAGANIGNHTVYWAKCSPQANALSVEANPDIFDVLLRNIELNDLQNVHAVRCALSSKNDKRVKSMLDKRHPGNSRVQISDEGRDKTRTLDAVYLEAQIKKPCSFIKIDCEHHDWEVLQGCEDLISEFKPSIAIEVWPQDLCTSRNVPYLKPMIEEFLASRGYQILTALGVNHIYTFGAEA